MGHLAAPPPLMQLYDHHRRANDSFPYDNNSNNINNINNYNNYNILPLLK